LGTSAGPRKLAAITGMEKCFFSVVIFYFVLETKAVFYSFRII
jgi:hypothetical protein